MPPQQPTAAPPSDPQPSTAGKAWDWMNTPLAPWIASAAHDIAQRYTAGGSDLTDQAANDLIPGMGTLHAMSRGLMGGVVEGAGNFAATLTSPVGIALTLAGLGPESSLARRLPAAKGFLDLPSVQALQRAVQVSAGTAFEGHGLQQTATGVYEGNYPKAAQGIAETAMGTVGAVHGLMPRSAMAHPVTKAAPVYEHPSEMPLGTPVPPKHPEYVPQAPVLTSNVPDPVAAAEADAQFQRQYQTFVNDPRHNAWYGQPVPAKQPLPDPATRLSREGLSMPDSDVAEAKSKLDAAREAARIQRGEPPKERTSSPSMPLAAGEELEEPEGAGTPRPSFASETGAVRIRPGGPLGPEPPEGDGPLDPLLQQPSQAGETELDALTQRPTRTRPSWLESEFAKGIAVPRWVKNPEDPQGGAWALPSGEWEEATGEKAPRTAQEALRARGLDPQSRAKATTPVPAEPRPVAPTKPGPTSIQRPWTDAPESGLPGIFSMLQRITDDLPSRGVAPDRLLNQIKNTPGAKAEAEWKGLTSFIQDHKERNGPNVLITKDDLQTFLNDRRLVIERKAMGRPKTFTAGPAVAEVHPPQPNFQEFTDWYAARQQGWGLLGRPLESLEPHQRLGYAQEYARERDQYNIDHPEELHTLLFQDDQGNQYQAEIRPMADEGYAAILPYEAHVGVSPAGVPRAASNTHTFPTIPEAEQWIRTRLQAGGSPQGNPQYQTYSVPGAHGGASQRYEEHLYTVPHDIPSNRVAPYSAPHFSSHGKDLAVHARGQHGYTLTDPATGETTTGTLIDEIQSDIHQKAGRMRRQEARRLREADIQAYMADHPEAKRRDIKDQFPMARYLAKVPENFGYVTPEIQSSIIDAQAQVQGLSEQRNLAQEKVRNLTRQLKEERAEARNRILEPYGGDRATAQRDASLRNYTSTEGDAIPFTPTSVDQLSPADRLKYDHAVQIVDRLDHVDMRDPRVADIATRLMEASEAVQNINQYYHDAYRLLNEAQDKASGKVPIYPYADDAYNTLAIKAHLYEVAADPNQSFIGVVGGLENADRYSLAQRYSKVRYDPEEGMLHIYDEHGTDIRRTFGGGDETFTFPLEVGPPAHLNQDLMERAIGEDLTEQLVDKVHEYTPEVTPGELRPIRRRPPITSREHPDPDVTNDPEDSDRWGTRHQREQALERYYENEREFLQENERNEIEVVELPGDELDEDAEENEPYFQAMERAQAQREQFQNLNAQGYSVQPLLPGFEDWSPSELAYLMFPDPEVPEDAVYVQRWGAKPSWMTTREWESEIEEGLESRYVYETEREAEEYADQMAWDYANNSEIEDPEDMNEFYENAGLEDHYDPNWDPDAADEDEDLEGVEVGEPMPGEVEDPEHPGMVREPSTVNQARHPTLNTEELAAGGRGMIHFYDEVIKTRIESLLKTFGWTGEMTRQEIPGGSGRTAYAWVAYLTPEQKAAIVKAGFSIMALALAIRDTDAPQDLKNYLMRLAILDRRKTSKGSGKSPVQVSPVPQ